MAGISKSISKARSNEMRTRSIVALIEKCKKVVGFAEEPLLIDYDNKKKKLHYVVKGKRGIIGYEFDKIDASMAKRIIKMVS